MNNINMNSPMSFYKYADEIQYLFLKRYLLITEIAENGPCFEVEYYYNPDDTEPVIENYDIVTALAEIDQQILDLLTTASKEDWYSKHLINMRVEADKTEKRLSSMQQVRFAKFIF